ncbi:Microtubules assembly and stabilization protein [Elasticomyces elasticus]|nr:Microtubules assembly and stabilization protein [Elasticomyces elasticus]KAK3624742.1 Microtubules assembly and stabilization protein [Elasticomyces elasticus]KAK4906746.1 Microtubules assembly and stabilization protein [Elasticomyces elasticus]KAK5765247.1 Microtubules assembly and stabilization protein [Elasticomyces elasticus]
MPGLLATCNHSEEGCLLDEAHDHNLVQHHHQLHNQQNQNQNQDLDKLGYNDSATPSVHDQYSTLLQSGSAARWKRQQNSLNHNHNLLRENGKLGGEGDYSNSNSNDSTSGGSSSAAATSGSGSEIRQKTMEEVHGVDVSWLHHPGQNKNGERKAVPSRPAQAPASTPSKQQIERKAVPAPNSQSLSQQSGNGNGNSNAPARSAPQPPPTQHEHHHRHHTAPGFVTPPALSPAATAKNNVAPAAPSTPSPSTATAAGAKPQTKRPGMLGRSSSQRTAGKDSEDGKTGGRRSSWMNSLSSKFSSSNSTQQLQTTSEQQQQQRPGVQPSQQQQPLASATQSLSAVPSTLVTHHEEAEEEEAALPAPVNSGKKESSFFSSLTRRLSSASTNTVPKSQMAMGGVCERRVLNIDPNRQRCLVPEMDPSRLRRVSFCVDVEIAGRPQYYSEEDERDEGMKNKNMKMKERAEGAALKRPQAVEDEKDRGGDVDAKAGSQGRGLDIPARRGEGEVGGGGSPGMEGGSLDDRDGESASRKKEKKMRSEAERKERKEKRRRKAEESGAVPVELSVAEEDEQDAVGGSATPPKTGISGNSLSRQTSGNANNNAMDTPPVISAISDTPPMSMDSGGAALPKQDKPTTDPVRIYRRCCQLRETPILKRITEQLMSPTCTLPSEPGVVNCLDLTGSRLQLADVTTLGDWLAVVPVRVLKFEDADLNDEGVRCILAGLLAAKRPQVSKRRSVQPRHRELGSGGGVRGANRHEERSGVIEKLNLKHNPRITRVGWKHIGLFVYMCRSLKAVDLSMNLFPETLAVSAVHPVIGSAGGKVGATLAPTRSETRETDAAEIFAKCLAERVGGSRLEELQVSECGFSAEQVRKIVDGAVMCGISRLGLAGNHLDDEGLGYVMRYFRSGVCHGLDLGGNDLHGRLGVVADAIREGGKKGGLPVWGLSLAGCNLFSEDLRVLFPALAKLPDFRFIDLSHNRELCGRDNGTVSLWRRYMGSFGELKRIHLADVGMSPKQAIALADCLPDGPRLAHLNVLENPMLSALASAREEAGQEEACAVYASLMAAVRVSSTLICIDIDVPSADNSEVVKALAKQVVAYSLRNMEQFAIAEATGHAVPNAMAKLTGPHGGERKVKEITVPDVLMHLVGHVEGNSGPHDYDDPAPDEDYIVGGTGVVKALQYVLGEKAEDLRRSSVPGTPHSTGAMTPRDGRPGSSAGFPPTEEQRGKAKAMSKNLLESARKIRQRLQPALIKEATAGDELSYRRLLFLDQTLESMVSRFEEEYPETRLSSAGSAALGAPSYPSRGSSMAPSDGKTDLSINTQLTEFTSTSVSDDEDDLDQAIRPPSAISRHGSEVGLASRALSLEEGRLHRLGQHLRREVIDSPAAMTAPETERIKKLGEKLEAISGAELKNVVENEGWESILRRVGGNYDDLRALQEQDPEGFEQFKESQRLARMNMRAER